MSAHGQSTNMGTSFPSHTLGAGTKTTDNKCKKNTVHTADDLWESAGTHLHKGAVNWNFVSNKPHGQEGKELVKY